MGEALELLFAVSERSEVLRACPLLRDIRYRTDHHRIEQSIPLIAKNRLLAVTNPRLAATDPLFGLRGMNALGGPCRSAWPLSSQEWYRCLATVSFSSSDNRRWLMFRVPVF